MLDSPFNQFLKTHIKLKDKSQTKVLEQALEFEGSKLEQKLMTAGLVDERQMMQLKADYYHIPFISFDKIEIEEGVHDLIPSSVVRSYRVVPFGRDGSKIKIAISDPTNLQVLEALEFLAKKNSWEMQLYLVTESDLNLLLQKSVGAAAEVKQALQEFTQTEKRRAKIAKPAGSSAAQEFAIEERAPVAKIVDGLISQALAQRASDVHIEPGEEESRVRVRIDGVLRQVFSFPLNAHNALVARIKILANLKIDEQRLPQDGRFRFVWNEEQVDFRVSTFPTSFGEKVVLRVLTRAEKIPTFEQLGLTGQREAIVNKAISDSHGMFLVTGPTGSGKSTTLFVALSQLNRPGVNIVTLEDPVEYILPGANQAQVNPDIGFTFAAGLRSILRQDPNIILVGEIRDRETAELAVHSSLTGHLVFSTLHTNDAVGALPRLMDMGVEPFLIIASTNAILAQRLVRTICPDCKKEAKITKEIADMIIKELETVPKVELEGLDLKSPKVYVGQGCKKCGDTGYRGRIGIFEAIEVNKDLAELVLAKASPNKITEEALKEGMVTIRQDGFIKVLKGITTVEEVLKETSEGKK